MREAGRLPPGQSATIKWPVLHTGAVPDFDPSTWDFRVGGLVEQPATLSYAELLALPRLEVVSELQVGARVDPDGRGQARLLGAPGLP